MAIKNLIANMRPSAFLKRMTVGDTSTSSKAKLIATRTILGKTVTFFENGLRIIKDIDLDGEEQFNSEILKLAHASILMNAPVGDKKACYVDATKNPVEVIVYGLPVEEFIKRAKYLIRTGQIDKDFVLNSPLKDTIKGKT
jgi:hypothetical protein